jgi:RNA recognition motif-containing protein
MKLFVANIPFDTTDAQLLALFEPYGDVSSAKAIFDRETGRAKGFGFVEMPNVEDAERAIEELTGTEMGNPPRPIRIEEAKERPPQGRGGYGGGRQDYNRQSHFDDRGGDNRGNRRDDRQDRRGGRR